MRATCMLALFAVLAFGAVAYDFDGDLDLSHCTSEGGSVNCADCRDSDSLCRQVYDKLGELYGDTHADDDADRRCTDTFPNSFVDMKTFVLMRDANGDIRRNCRKMKPNAEMELGFQSDNFFLLDTETDSPYTITKVMLGHPNRANHNVGAVGLKRILMHKHSTSGEWVADVYSEAYCVKCHNNVFNGILTSQATRANKESFYNCANNAFYHNGSHTLLKTDYECDSDAKKHFGPAGASF